MDRIIVYPGAIPLDTDMLNTNRNTMTALHALISATLGTMTAVDGLNVVATTPASMNVTVTPGSITQYAPMDGTNYGSLGADTADSVVKMGIAVSQTTLSLLAPSTAGTAIAYLVEASFAETDQNLVVLPYYNAANPAQPYLGPNNTGAAQATVRQQSVTIQLKSSAAVPVGSTVIPPVDPGYVALAAILVLAGATEVTSGSIGSAPTTRFTPWKLPDLMPGYAFSQAFTSSGTFTVPNGVTRLKLTVLGGGGAGASGGAGGGGGAGGKGELWLTGMIPGTAIPVTVGASGTPVFGAAGGPGGTSSFGSYLSATGGAGGSGSTGGAGGTVSGATVFYPGSYGTDAVPGVARGGDGGGPGAGKGGSAGASGINAPALAGGGGGASGSTSGGGSGGGGIVIVEW